ncbi:hypothetical protein M9458_040562, partial [Cirrhinus mrigala]
VVFGMVQGLRRGHLSGRAGDARRHCGFPPALFLLLRETAVCSQGTGFSVPETITTNWPARPPPTQ